MAVTVLCPHCGVGCAIPEGDLNREGTCPVCGGLFLPSAARRAPPPLAPPPPLPPPLPPPVPAPAPRVPRPAPRPASRGPGGWPGTVPRPLPEPGADLTEGARAARRMGAVLLVVWMCCGLLGVAYPDW